MKAKWEYTIHSDPFGYKFNLEVVIDDWYIHFICAGSASKERITSVVNFSEKIKINIYHVTPGRAQDVDVNRIYKSVRIELNKHLEKTNGKNTETS